MVRPKINESMSSHENADLTSYLHAKEGMTGNRKDTVIKLFSILSWTTSPPCVNRGYNSSYEEAREHGVSLSHVDALRMVGGKGK